MINSLFVTSATGEVLIERHWRGVTPRNICDLCWDELNPQDKRSGTLSPLLHTSKHYLVSVFREDIYVIAVLAKEVPPLLVIELLQRVVDIFVEYFGAASEGLIKDNFASVYQLLEEMLDNGNPLTTEPNALKAMIAPPSVMGRLQAVATGKSNVSDVLPDGTISSMPWRKSGVKYAQNEIYLDIIEEVDAVVDRKGQVVSSEVSGAIVANSRLSGIPDLCLSFLDAEVIKDCSFHPCVRYTRFEQDRVVSFVPPDGTFELMRYRVNTKTNVTVPIYVTPVVTMSDQHNAGYGRIQIQIGQRQTSSLVTPNRKAPMLIEDVALSIPFPKCVKTATLSATVGTVLYDEATKVASWTIGRLTPNATKVPQLSGSMIIQGLAEGPPPIQVKWKVPVASVSGIQIAALQLKNERYRPYKGVRTITKSGRFQIRM